MRMIGQFLIMAISKKLLEILCCPVSHSPLSLVNKPQLSYLNDQIRDGEVVTVDGEAVTEPLEAALITQDGKVLYPVRDDIPVLLYEAGIGTTQFKDFPG